MIDLVIVGGYFALLLVVGWRARSGSPDSYWVAGRQYGTIPVSASLVATIFGASSTVGIIGLGYSRGLTGAWWSLVGGLALIPFGFVLAKRVRDLGVYTLPDVLYRAYGGKVSLVGAAVIVMAWCGVVAAQMVAGALLLESVFPVGFEGALLAVTFVFVLYTLWGGQLSVVRTDSWQFMLFVGALLATLILVLRAGLGSGPLLEGVPSDHLRFPISRDFGWYQVVVFYPLIVGMPYLVGPDIYSRIFCARDSTSARNASLLAALAVIPLSFLLATLGLLLSSLFPGLPPEAAFPHALSELAPAGLKGVIVVGVLGAIMSSADTTLISASTILSLNVVGPLLRVDENRRLPLTRLFVVILGSVAWGLASFQQGIISSLLLAYTVFVGGIALPTLGSFWRDRLGITSFGALWAVILGGSTALLAGIREGALLLKLTGEGGTEILESVLGPEYGSILPLLVSGCALFGVSWLSRRRSAAILLAGVFLVGCGGSSKSTGPDPADGPDPICPAPGMGITVGGRPGVKDATGAPARRIVLMGGGAEHDQASTRFAEGAGGGDIVILRVTGSLSSYPDYFLLSLSPSPAPASAVVVRTGVPEAADDPAVLCWLNGAEAVWLAGGSQWNYLGLWPAAVQSALSHLHSRGGAVGGTSAGAMSLGEAAFDAQFGSVTSSEALLEPLRQEVSISYPEFSAPELHGVLVDSHFSDRGREGRLLAFLARFLNEKARDEVLGVGLDEGVALEIADGAYRVSAPGDRKAWFYRVTGPADLRVGEPLNLLGIQRFSLGHGETGSWPLDLSLLTGVELRVENGMVELVQ